MLANFTHNRCVKGCRPVFINVGILTQKPIDLLLTRTKPVALKIVSYPVFNEQGQNIKLQVSIQQPDRKKTDCFSVDWFCSHCNSVSEAMGCFYHFGPCQEIRTPVTEEDIQRGSKKREFNELRQSYIHENYSHSLKCWKVGVRVLQTVQKKQLCWSSCPRTLPLQALTCSSAFIRKDKEKKVIWLGSVPYWRTWKLEIKIANIYRFFKNT